MKQQINDIRNKKKVIIIKTMEIEKNHEIRNCSNKFKTNYLRKCKLLKLITEEKGNLNKPTTVRETESIAKSLSRK